MRERAEKSLGGLDASPYLRARRPCRRARRGGVPRRPSRRGGPPCGRRPRRRMPARTRARARSRRTGGVRRARGFARAGRRRVRAPRPPRGRRAAAGQREPGVALGGAVPLAAPRRRRGRRARGRRAGRRAARHPGRGRLVDAAGQGRARRERHDLRRHAGVHPGGLQLRHRPRRGLRLRRGARPALHRARQRRRLALDRHGQDLAPDRRRAAHPGRRLDRLHDRRGRNVHRADRRSGVRLRQLGGHGHLPLDRRRPDLGARRGRAVGRAGLPARRRPDQPVARLRGDERRPVPLDRRRPQLDRRQAADRLLLSRVL